MAMLWLIYEGILQILTLLAVFILAPLNEEILFRGVMLNAEGSPHKSAIA
ncbi:CPBP family intramembrane metalloprotease [Citrobacter freundii]|nr:CPBP family intramembrane metalloprotease [Citrobacter freundii]